MIKYDLIERKLSYSGQKDERVDGQKIKDSIEPVLESFYQPCVINGIDPDNHFENDQVRHLNFNHPLNNWIMKGCAYKGRSLFGRKAYHYMVFDYGFTGIPCEEFDPEYPRICAVKSSILVDLKQEPYTVLMLNSEFFLRRPYLYSDSNRLALFSAVTHALWKKGDQERLGCVTAGLERFEKSNTFVPTAQNVEGKFVYRFAEDRGSVILKKNHYKNLLKRGINSVIKDERYALYILGWLYKSYLADKSRQIIINADLLNKLNEADQSRIKFINDPRRDRNTLVPSFIGRAIKRNGLSR